MVIITDEEVKPSDTFIKESTLYLPGTDLKKEPYYNQAKNYRRSYRLVLLLDAIKDLTSLYGQSTDFELDVIFNEIQSLFIRKYPLKIFYALSELKFSSFWEMSKILNLANMTWIRSTIFKMEKLGIIREISKKENDFEIIKSYWREEYPTSPYTPKLFRTNEPFEPVAKAYADEVMKKYISKREYNTIQARKTRIEKFYHLVKAQKKLYAQKKSQSLGVCMRCGHLITETHTAGKTYHNYAAGFVCRSCNQKATKRMMKEWMQGKK